MMANTPTREIGILVCESCIKGEGAMCHVPECFFCRCEPPDPKGCQQVLLEHGEDVAALRKEVAILREAAKWQPIETAPKGGEGRCAP